MTSKGLVLVLIAVVAVSACGRAARPAGDANQPEPTVVESPTTSVGELRSPATISTSPTVMPEPAPADGTEQSPSTTSTVDGPASTTTNPTESIDLAEVRDALDALDALLGGLDGHIGSVDLDEGETP